MSLICKCILQTNTLLRGTLLTASVCQSRNYAARKGTREKARKKKVKVEVKKSVFVPENIRKREKMLANRPKRKFDDSWKMTTNDNVYVMKYFKCIIYPFVEAVKCHRQTNHPTIYNVPNAPVNVKVELNMQGEKKTRFLENFQRMAAVPHSFDHGEERNVLAFSKDPEQQKAARNAGAMLTGGVELIKQLQTGEISLHDYHYAVAHPDILHELVTLRGVMRKKFPNPKNETLSPDLASLVKKFTQGISYQAIKDEYEKDFGLIEATLGNLTMSDQQLEENFAAFIQDVNKMKPRRAGGFIYRCLLISPPSREELKVDHEIYLKTENIKEDDNDEEAEEESEKAEAVN